MKRIISIVLIMIAMIMVMSSALKPKEDDTQKQTINKEEMTVVALNEGNNTEINEESINSIQRGKYIATKDKRFIDTLQIEKMLSNLPEKYEKEIVFEANWGNGEGEYAVAGESPPVGPGNIYVDEKDNIYIWDLGNYCIIKYNKDGELIKSYKIPKKWAGYSRRIFVKNDTLSLEWGGIDLKTGKKVKKPEIKDTDKEGKQVSIDWHQEMYNKTKEIGLTNHSSLIEDKKNDKIFKEIKEKDANADETAGPAFLGIDNEGNYYLLLDYWISSGKGNIPYAKDAIYKYSPNNELLAIIDIPEATLDILWGQVASLNYYIDGNGDIYALLPKGKFIDRKKGIGYDLDLDKIILLRYKLVK